MNPNHLHKTISILREIVAMLRTWATTLSRDQNRKDDVKWLMAKASEYERFADELAGVNREV